MAQDEEVTKDEGQKAAGAGAGMGLLLTTIFIAGQMAGGGVLMLPGDHSNNNNNNNSICVTSCPDQHRPGGHRSHPLLHHQWGLRGHEAGAVLAHGGGQVPCCHNDTR